MQPDPNPQTSFIFDATDSSVAVADKYTKHEHLNQRRWFTLFHSMCLSLYRRHSELCTGQQITIRNKRGAPERSREMEGGMKEKERTLNSVE
jgi:hypothetical protein